MRSISVSRSQRIITLVLGISAAVCAAGVMQFSPLRHVKLEPGNYQTSFLGWPPQTPHPLHLMLASTREYEAPSLHAFSSGLPFPTASANIQRTGFVPSGPEPPLELKWSITLDAPSAVVAGKKLLYVTTRADVHALNPENGEEVWRYTMPFSDEHFRTPPSLYGNALYASIADVLVCLDASSGEMRWRFDADGNIFPAVAVLENTVIFGTGDWRDVENPKVIYALDRHTGRELWRFEYADAKRPAWIFAPAVDEAEARVYLGARVGPENLLFTLDARSGQRIWTTHIPDTPDLSVIGPGHLSVYRASYSPIRHPGSSGISLGPTEIISCLDGLQVFGKTAGEHLWSFPPVGYTRQPALADSTIVFATEGVVYMDMAVVVVHKTSRRELWRYHVPAPFTDSTLSQDRVYLTSGWLDLKEATSLVAVLSRHTGEELWSTALDDYVGLFPPTVTPDAVYVTGLKGIHKFGR